MLLVLLILSLQPAWAGPAWRESLPEALKEARSSGKPVLIDFEAPWCYSCYYMEKRVLGGEAFSKASAGLVLLKADVDREEGHALKEKYAVTFLPTYVLADAKGEAQGRIVGEQTEGDFLDRLQALLKAAPPPDPLDLEVARLISRLAAGEFDRAAKEAAKTPQERLKALRQRKDWQVLSARLELMRAARSKRRFDPESLKILLSLEDSCELAYDVASAEGLVDALASEPRRALLEAQRLALEDLVGRRFFVDPAQRCADFRTGLEVLAEVYEKQGDKKRREELLARAVAFLEGQGLMPGEDRNFDDNLRFFLELSGDDARLREHFRALIDAYPADYVYAYRFARYLEERRQPQAALPWIEKADKLAYGANRLAVTKVRAKILADLGRRDEALALLKRDIKAGKRSFPKEAESLKSLSKEISRAPAAK